jgi:hypothetical protein
LDGSESFVNTNRETDHHLFGGVNNSLSPRALDADYAAEKKADNGEH